MRSVEANDTITNMAGPEAERVRVEPNRLIAEAQSLYEKQILLMAEMEIQITRLQLEVRNLDARAKGLKAMLEKHASEQNEPSK